MIQEDYISKMIRQMVRAIIKLVLKKDIFKENLVDKAEDPVAYDLLAQLKALADKGKINEAENMLSDRLDGQDEGSLALALEFYLYINEFSNEFLEENNYSRDEIKEGIMDVSKIFGIQLDPLLFS